jgi:hypothetical protein
MNVVRMCGGIGNQMFQYAFGRALNVLGKEVGYDTSWYNVKRSEQGPFPRPFRLPMFQLQNYYNTKFNWDNPFIYEKNVRYNPSVFNMKNDNNFDGYWQYYVYYEKIIPILQKELQLGTAFYTEDFMKIADKIMSCESVSMHVRRGDYQLHRVGAFRDLPARYYFDALKMVEGEVFIFSDDLPWCKETFKQDYFKKKLHFVDLVDYQCMELMRLCKHNITTNSTFSWWGALLNENPDKVVICPVTYLGDTITNSENLRYPKEWIKIEDYAVHHV